MRQRRPKSMRRSTVGSAALIFHAIDMDPLRSIAVASLMHRPGTEER